MIEQDVQFVKSILPEHYAVQESKKKGSVHCKSAIGIRHSPYLNQSSGQMVTDAEDEEHWGYVFEAIKQHFGSRFQEVDHNTNFCHVDFTIYLKAKDYIVQENMICPATNEHCDDECCPVGAICNLKSEDEGTPGLYSGLTTVPKDDGSGFLEVFKESLVELVNNHKCTPNLCAKRTTGGCDMGECLLDATAKRKLKK